MVQAGKLDPESLVARIVAELEANPAARPLLLRALLTNEFKGVPLRLDRIEADIREMKVDIRRLKADVAELKSDVAELKKDVAELKSDVAELKGDSLEFKLPQRIRPFLSQKLALRGARIMQSVLGLDQGDELSEAVERAADAGTITDAEETRILATDLILRARRKLDRSTTVWVTVEASHTIDGYDIERARASADLRRVFGADSVAVTMGYGVRAGERSHAEALGVEIYVADRRAA